MKNLLLLTFVLGSTLLPSQASGEDKKPTKLNGVVRYYKPGEKIAIDIRPQVEVTYNLADKDSRYTVDAGIQVGSKVVTEETEDANGKKVVTIHADH